MPYMVTPDGEIICDTANEALSLQRAILNHMQKQEKPFDKPSRKTIKGSVSDPELIKSILESPNQKHLIKLLHDHPTGCTDSQIRDRLKLENNMALSGVTTAVLRKAKRHGLEGDDILIRTWNKEKDETLFMLSESFRRIIDNCGGIK